MIVNLGVIFLIYLLKLLKIKKGSYIVRDDDTTIISYSDGALKTRHKDGTTIFTSPKKDTIIIEHPSRSIYRNSNNLLLRIPF